MARQPIVSNHNPAEGNLLAYVLGFGMSVVLTVVAYLLVTHQAAARTPLIAIIISLALVQFMVQLVFFLHLGTEARPRWKFMVFSFMLLVVLILVLGSLWIMNNLNYHMMPQHDLEHYMHTEEGI